MRRKKMKKEKRMETNPEKRLIEHVHAYHKHLDYDYLRSLPISHLLSLAHPNYREYHRNQIYGS